MPMPRNPRFPRENGRAGAVHRAGRGGPRCRCSGSGEEGARDSPPRGSPSAPGVSVGSLYQYFPNKAAILFRLQSDEWRADGRLLHGILEDARDRPRDGCARWFTPSSTPSARRPRSGSR